MNLDLNRSIRLGLVFIIAYGLSILFAPRTTSAAELIMFDSPICEICKRFEEEVGKTYGNEKEIGVKIFPIRRIDINEGKVDFKLKKAVWMTPTFVFVDQGKEITRFVGYPGREFFFQLLNAAAEEFTLNTTASDKGQ